MIDFCLYWPILDVALKYLIHFYLTRVVERITWRVIVALIVVLVQQVVEAQSPQLPIVKDLLKLS